MKTVSRRSTHEPEPTKGSRFLCVVAPVDSEDAARAVLAEVASALPDASHHCWAWRLASPSIDRAGDDGEPTGSAGRPILAQLTGRDLVNTAVIVTRYFGGTKLGVGGLVRAYGGAAAQTLDRCTLIERIEQVTVTVEHDHAAEHAIVETVALFGATTMAVTYGAAVTREVATPLATLDSFVAAVGDATRGRAAVRIP